MSLSCVGALICALLGNSWAKFVAEVQATPPQARVAAGDSGGQAVAAAPSLEAQVMANLRQETIGTATLADLELPDEYLRRVAGRILRASFEENFRIVVADSPKPSSERNAETRDADAGAAPANSASSGPSSAEKPAASTESDRRKSTFDAPLSILWAIGVALVAGLAVLVALRRAKQRGARAR